MELRVGTKLYCPLLCCEGFLTTARRLLQRHLTPRLYGGWWILSKINCEVEVPYETSSAKSASRARSARSCVVMDLVVTEQVEDPHVVYAVGDAEVDKGSWSRGGCQGTPAKEAQPVDYRLKEEQCQLILEYKIPRNGRLVPSWLCQGRHYIQE